MIIAYWLPALNIVLSAIAGALIAWELFHYAKYLTLIERIGKGGMGAFLLLTIAPIMANRGAPYLSRAGTPFNVWPSTGLRVCIIVLVVGRILRHRKHERANKASVEQAKAYLAGKRS